MKYVDLYNSYKVNNEIGLGAYSIEGAGDAIYVNLELFDNEPCVVSDFNMDDDCIYLTIEKNSSKTFKLSLDEVIDESFLNSPESKHGQKEVRFFFEDNGKKYELFFENIRVITVYGAEDVGYEEFEHRVVYGETWIDYSDYEYDDVE